MSECLIDRELSVLIYSPLGLYQMIRSCSSWQVDFIFSNGINGIRYTHICKMSITLSCILPEEVYLQVFPVHDCGCN